MTDDNPDTNTELSKLKEDLERARTELTILYEVSNAMRKSLDLHDILYIILTCVTAHNGIGFNRAVLFLVNHKNRTLEAKLAIGPESGEDAAKIWEYISHSHRRLEELIDQNQDTQTAFHSKFFQSLKDLQLTLGPKEDNLLVNAYQLGIPVHITKDEIQQFSNDPLLQKFKTTELLIMPLKAKDKVNGLIVVDNLYTKKPITENDLKIFTMLANQAGLAIENSQLYEMVKHRGDTDSLTGLWNHGFFQSQLTKQFLLAKKDNSLLSLLMIDLDNFKLLNDKYGHHNGDILLKEIAQILRNYSRDMDFLCRYGGEEFAMILPQTSKEQAYGIAERIRQQVESMDFSEKVNDKKMQPLTLSIGVAAFPTDANKKENLIQIADKAMYTAKFSGKNRTCLASPA